MFRARWLLGALMIGLVLAPPAARARAMGVDIWTDRGKDAVYEPGEPVEIKVRASDDGYLLVYDIDSEGYVRVLYPYEGSSGYVAGRQTYRVPPYQSGLQLVVQGPVGQGYIVALVSREPFNALPRFLRPYDPQAEGAGYVGEEEDDGGRDLGRPHHGRPVRGHGAHPPAGAERCERPRDLRHGLHLVLHPPARALPALPLQRLPPSRPVGVVGWLRSLLHELLGVRLPRLLGLELGTALLVRHRALLLLRAALLSVRALRPALLLVVERPAAVEHAVERPSHASQDGAARGLHAAESLRLDRAGRKASRCRRASWPAST